MHNDVAMTTLDVCFHESYVNFCIDFIRCNGYLIYISYVDCILDLTEIRTEC